MYLHPFDNVSTGPPPPPTRGLRSAPPPPPAPPSTPVIKQNPIPATQKYHHQLLQQLPKMLANGIKMSKPEDFVWVDPTGRPTTPPRPKPSKNQAQNTREVAFDLIVNDNLGLMIRGGIEYGLGIYVTGVDQHSAAFRNGLRIGDEILSVNGKLFHQLTHDEAVNVLKSNHRLSFLLRYVGKVPHSSLVPNRAINTSSKITKNADKLLPPPPPQPPPTSLTNPQMQRWKNPACHDILNISTTLPNSNNQSNGQSPKPHQDLFDYRSHGYSRCGDGRESTPEILDNHVDNRLFTTASAVSSSSRIPNLTEVGTCVSLGNRFVRQQEEEVENAFDENGDMTSPELSMVLEKAIVLLNGKEFSALRRILADYQTTEINIDTFAENLLQLITDQEKASFFTEIRELVRQEDLMRFDRLIFGRKGSLFDLLVIPPESAPCQLKSIQADHLRNVDFGMEISTEHYAYHSNLQRDLYIDDSEVRHIPLDENGYMTCPPVKHPPLYIQQEIPDAYDQKLQLQIHPSIAGFPSHVRKANRIVTFKGSQTIEIPKCCSTLGIAIEGGTNTKQTLPRIISIQPTGAAYQNCDLRVGQLISEVDGFKLSGLPHEAVAKLIAERFAKRDSNTLTLVVMDQKLTPAEMRRSFMQPQN